MPKRTKRAIQIPYEWFESCRDLDGDEFKAVFEAMQQYDETGELPELPKHLLFMMKAFMPYIDERKEAYATKCQKNAANGKKAGQAKAGKIDGSGGAAQPCKASDSSERYQTPAVATNAGESTEPGDSSEGYQTKRKVAKLADNDTGIDTETDIDTDRGVAAEAAYARAREGAPMPPPPPPQPQQQQSGYIVISLPLSNGGVYDLDANDLAHLEQLFPRIDVLTALKKYQGFLMDHPAKMPGPKMMPERIKEWLAQEKSALKPRGQPPVSEDEIDAIDQALQAALGDPWKERS